MRLRQILLPTVLLILWPSLLLAQGTYTQIDFPGALSTQVSAVDTAGDVVGLYIDDLGGHGFLLKNGVYTTIDYPGAQYSYLYGMNDEGQMVGVASPNGFLYDSRNQSFTVIDYPDAAFTYPLAINNSGTIVGFFQHQKGHNYITDSFELTGSAYQIIGPKSAMGTMVYGISTSGEVVGFTDYQGSVINFIDKQSTVLPLKLSNVPAAQVYGVNPQASAIVGSYEPITGLTGFVYRNSTLQPVSFPGSITTVANGINSSGEVVGYFIDQNIAVHGFTWTPPPGDRP